MIMDIRRKGLIGTLVGHAVLLACLVVVSTNADVQTNQVISGWLQAIGSVLAIVFAVIVANTQYLRAEEEKKKAEIEHCVKLSMQANRLCEGMRSIMVTLGEVNLSQPEFDRRKRLLENSIRVYNSFSVDLIQSGEAFSAWGAAGHSCEDFLGSCHSNDGDVHLVKAVRLPHMERCVERAEKSADKLQGVMFSMIGV